METLRIKREISYDGIQDFYLIAEPIERRPKILRRLVEKHLSKDKVG